MARRLNVSIGDQVRLILTEGTRFTPFGRVPAQRLFTVSGIFGVGADVDNQIALIAPGMPSDCCACRQKPSVAFASGSMIPLPLTR